MKFKTPNYEGTWISFDGDRMRFREQVEKYLREVLTDPEGKLVVDHEGPHWRGSVELKGLSYSHSDAFGVVVFSRLMALGVDIERRDRLLKNKYLEIALRFFHVSEHAWLKQQSVFDGTEKFLELWLKKEAYSKLIRKNLVEVIRHPVASVNAKFEPLVKMHHEYRAMLASSI